MANRYGDVHLPQAQADVHLFDNILAGFGLA